MGTRSPLSSAGAQAANLKHRYLWGHVVDEILADETVTSLTSAGSVIWPLADNLGTARDLAKYNSGTNTTTVANHRAYDSFGNLKSETNTAVDLLFGYTGRMLDEGTGLQNNLNRWYDGKVGRWLSEDPLGFEAGDTNVYRYVENQATTHTDPSGLSPKSRVVGWVVRRSVANLSKSPRSTQRNKRLACFLVNVRERGWTFFAQRASARVKSRKASTWTA